MLEFLTMSGNAWTLDRRSRCAHLLSRGKIAAICRTGDRSVRQHTVKKRLIEGELSQLTADLRKRITSSELNSSIEFATDTIG